MAKAQATGNRKQMILLAVLGAVLVVALAVMVLPNVLGGGDDSSAPAPAPAPAPAAAPAPATPETVPPPPPPPRGRNPFTTPW